MIPNIMLAEAKIKRLATPTIGPALIDDHSGLYLMHYPGGRKTWVHRSRKGERGCLMVSPVTHSDRQVKSSAQIAAKWFASSHLEQPFLTPTASHAVLSEVEK